MLQTAIWLVLCSVQSGPATEPTDWKATVKQWISASWTWSQNFKLPETAGASPQSKDAQPSAVDSEGNADSGSEYESELLAHHEEEPQEDLEAIEESRPDDLDEFSEVARHEKPVDAEELAELPGGGILTADEEIDWTTPAD